MKMPIILTYEQVNQINILAEGSKEIVLHSQMDDSVVAMTCGPGTDAEIVALIEPDGTTTVIKNNGDHSVKV